MRERQIHREEGKLKDRERGDKGRPTQIKVNRKREGERERERELVKQKQVETERPTKRLINTNGKKMFAAYKTSLPEPWAQWRERVRE